MVSLSLIVDIIDALPPEIRVRWVVNSLLLVREYCSGNIGEGVD